MYQAWPWGGTAAAATASPTTAGFPQAAATGQVAPTTQWPAGYSQYAMTPEMQQQWAAWASQAQYAYTGALPVGQVPTTTSYTTGYAEYETASSSSKDATSVDKSLQSANEKPKNPAEELVPKDNSELEKLNKLKEQAEQWKTLQQPAAAVTWPYATTTAVSVNATAVTTSDATLKSNIQPSTNVAESGATQMDKEDEEFERQFKDWEKQFEAWKRENSNHPDKEAFARYEKQWQEWRSQLLQKKEQMQKAKALKLAAQSASEVTVAPAAVPPVVASAGIPPNVTGVDLNNQTSVTTLADPTTTVAPNMFYQPAQYMYMQQYMYPGSVPGSQTTMPQQPPFTGQNIPPNFAAPAPSTQPLLNDQNASAPMNFNDPNMGMKGMQNFDQNRDRYNYSQRSNENNAEEFPNYEGFENPNMFPPEMEDYQQDAKFGRGSRGGRGARGMRGRGRARGRGGQSRWSDGPEMEQRAGGNRGQSLLPTPPLKFSDSAQDGRPPLLDSVPPPFEGGQPPFDDGQPPFDDGHAPFGARQPPFDMRPPFERQPPFDGVRPPFDKRPPFPGDQPNFESGQQSFEGGQPPFEGGQPPFEGGQPPFDAGQPPFEGRQPFEEGPPPYEYPPEDLGDFAPDQRQQRPFSADDKSAQRQNFKSDDRFSSHKGPFPPDEFNESFTPHAYDERYPPPKDRFHSKNEEFPLDNDGFPPKGARFPPENERFPVEDERFPPGPGRFQGSSDRFPRGPDRRPPGPEAFPSDPERFPPVPEEFPQGPMDDRFLGRDFDEYPPDNDMYGPPPFREDFPPFDDRFPPARGRFSGRGRRMPRGEFDRFGPPPFPPGMVDEGFGPDFPPDDRFGFHGDGPPRMPHGRGMRPNFEQGFPGRGRFPEDRFYGDGPPGRAKSIDYTHRPASAVMGEDYNPHYEFESDFQNDVVQYRAAPSKRIKRAPNVEKKKDA